MKNFKLILLIFLLLIIPMITSLLLDLDFVAAQFVRQLLIYVLIFIEVLVVLFVIFLYLKSLQR